MQDFKKLQVWKKSHDLTLRIYDLTSRFLHEEIYGLTSQIRRACASIPTNIAEGCGRNKYLDKIDFIFDGRSSAPLSVDDTIQLEQQYLGKGG